MSFTAGSQDGEYNHKLTIHEMPTYQFTAGQVYEYKLANTGINKSNIDPYSSYQFLYIDQSSNTPTSILSTNAIGGDANHNNIQPYITVYIWHRTR